MHHQENSKLRESNMEQSEHHPEVPTAKQEWLSFLFVTVILMPFLAVAVVGGYGFTVWMLQVFVLGPPGTGS